MQVWISSIEFRWLQSSIASEDDHDDNDEDEDEDADDDDIDDDDDDDDDDNDEDDDKIMTMTLMIKMTTMTKKMNKIAIELTVDLILAIEQFGDAAACPLNLLFSFFNLSIFHLLLLLFFYRNNAAAISLHLLL